MLAFIGWVMVSIALLAILVLAILGGFFLWIFFAKSNGSQIIKDVWAEVKDEQRTS